MNINFLESRLLDLSYKIEQDLKDSVKVSHVVAYSENDSKRFLVQFEVLVTSVQGVAINVVYAGFFSTEDEITTDFKEGDFVKVNAPAITYPYLRAFVGNLTLNAGISPITLPVINFQAMARQESVGESDDEVGKID